MVQRIVLCFLFGFTFIWEKKTKTEHRSEEKILWKNKTERMHNRGTCGLDKKNLRIKKIRNKKHLSWRKKIWKNKIESSGCSIEERAGQIKNLRTKTLGTWGLNVVYLPNFYSYFPFLFRLGLGFNIKHDQVYLD
jgi:hypothetical protein